MEQRSRKPVIRPGCIGCGLCESIAPEVFRVKDISRVQEGVDYEAFKEKIEKAVQSCPVRVIEFPK